MERICENCYYSKPAVRDDVVYCSYLGDTIGDGKNQEKSEHVIDSIRFKGFVYESFVQLDPKGKEEPKLLPCVTLKSQCRKFHEKRDN